MAWKFDYFFYWLGFCSEYSRYTKDKSIAKFGRYLKVAYDFNITPTLRFVYCNFTVLPDSVFYYEICLNIQKKSLPQLHNSACWN